MMQTEPIAHLDLWRRHREGHEEDARRRLVEQYVRLVKYVAGRMAIGLPHYVEFNDLISAGLLGLIQAVDHFDHGRGIKFETYAIPRIRGAILDELRSQDWFPRSLRRKAKQLEEAYGTLEAQLGRPATDEEVARHLGIPLADLDGMLGEVAVAAVMSLDAESDGEDGEQPTSLGEYLADPRSEDIERALAEQEMRELIARRIGELPEKEQLVLVLYYYEELTLKEIGEILDVTESRVCQVHTKAILRLQGKIRRHEGRGSIGRLSAERRGRGGRPPRPAPETEEEAAETGKPLVAALNVTACLAALPLLLLLAGGLAAP